MKRGVTSRHRSSRDRVTSYVTYHQVTRRLCNTTCIGVYADARTEIFGGGWRGGRGFHCNNSHALEQLRTTRNTCGLRDQYENVTYEHIFRVVQDSLLRRVEGRYDHRMNDVGAVSESAEWHHCAPGQQPSHDA